MTIVLTQSSPALLLLLLTLSRSLLTSSCRAVRGLYNCLVVINQHHTAQGQSHSALMVNSAITSLAHITDDAKVKPQLFEALLHDVESSVKNIREKKPEFATQSKRETMEREILIQAKIPEEYGEVVEKIILTRVWEKNGEKSGVILAKESDLYFSDYALLEFSMGEGNRRDHKFIDAFSKVVIDDKEGDHGLKDTEADFMPQDPDRQADGKTVFRRCTRCCAQTEDLVPRRQKVSWLVALQRNCFCGGFWMVGR